MNQTNIFFLSGAYEDELMFNYDEALCELVKKKVDKLNIVVHQFNPGVLIGEEIIYNDHIFNIILKNSILSK